ncbi:MAG: hypothetical protein KAT05_13120, partial [Spirochaetes bacterium]|nr:hypothetical protein [Spirochaetota bacterium]
DKQMKGIDLKGFLIKKSISPVLKDVPIFLIGDFISNELKNYKKENIKAFISTPINPGALLERLYLFFSIPQPKIKNRTPMLVDMHSKNNIIIIQIEGNFEPDKLEILNYEIRSFCRQKKIKIPKIFFIIPSLYPESITKENLDILFKFLEFPELNISSQNVKILSQCSNLLGIVKKNENYKQFEIVNNFIDGIQKLNLDIDNKKIISIDHLKEGGSYIFDLYDKVGMVRIPALTIVTKNMLDYLLKSGEKKLTYYSDTALEEIRNKEVISSSATHENLIKIMSEYDTIDDEFDMVKNLNDKMNLFLRKLTNSNILVVSNNKTNNAIISNALISYVNIDFMDTGKPISKVDMKRYILIFLDMELSNPSSIELLQKIRSQATRRQISVIITSNQMTREILSKLKTNGTDNVLLSPFSASKLLMKIFESVSSDRKT